MRGAITPSQVKLLCSVLDLHRVPARSATSKTDTELPHAQSVTEHPVTSAISSPSRPPSPTSYSTVLKELVETEVNYVEQLRILVTQFVIPMRERQLVNTSTVFPMIENILRANEVLLTELQAANGDAVLISQVDPRAPNGSARTHALGRDGEGEEGSGKHVHSTTRRYIVRLPLSWMCRGAGGRGGRWMPRACDRPSRSWVPS